MNQQLKVWANWRIVVQRTKYSYWIVVQRTKYSYWIVVQRTKYSVNCMAKVNKSVWRMPRLTEAMKDVISCDKLGLGANDLWPQDFRMGQPNSLKDYYLCLCREANGGNWNILVPPGEENNSDSPSSGERPGKSPNRWCSNALPG